MGLLIRSRNRVYLLELLIQCSDNTILPGRTFADLIALSGFAFSYVRNYKYRIEFKFEMVKQVTPTYLHVLV